MTMIRISMLCLLSLLCLTGTLNAQVQLLNLDSNAPDSNILFAGDRNRIKVMGADGKNVRLHADGVPVKKDSATIFSLTPHRKGAVRVEVFAGQRKVGSFPLVVAEIGEPIVHVGAIHDTIATVKEVLANPEIIIKTHPLWISKMHFHSAILKITSRGELLYEGRMANAHFNEVQVQAITLLQPADRIQISVFVAHTDASVKQLPPISLVIK